MKTLIKNVKCTNAHTQTLGGACSLFLGAERTTRGRWVPLSLSCLYYGTLPFCFIFMTKRTMKKCLTRGWYKKRRKKESRARSAQDVEWVSAHNIQQVANWDESGGGGRLVLWWGCRQKSSSTNTHTHTFLRIALIKAALIWLFNQRV